MTTTTLAVPVEAFDRLAEGDGDALGALRLGQRSKRLLLLHELLSTASRRAPWVCADADLARAFAVLGDAQRRSRHAADEVLLQPHVGAWATACLRSLASAGRRGVRPDDIGHAGAVAAAAALRAGQPFELTAHLRDDGSIMFPTYGMARPARTGGWCRLRARPGAGGVEIATADGTIAIPFTTATDDDATWQPLRRLRSTAQGITLDVLLDDLGPYRGCGQLDVAPRLDAAAVVDWQAQMDEAWSLLVDDHRAAAEALATGVTSLVPLRATENARELSATCHEAIGAVAMTPPEKPLAMALALVHEFQHTKLSALLDLVPLVERTPGRSFYSPWRADPRPLSGLLQGTYAFLGLAVFWEVHRRRTAPDDMPGHQDWAHFELAIGRKQVACGIDTLQESGRLRPEGARFVDGMRRRLAQLGRVLVPARPRSFARLACFDHAMAWRLRNLRPDADQVASAADAWLAGQPCPWSHLPAARAVDEGGPIPSIARLGLIRHRLAWPERWRDEPGRASPADLHLVAGDLAAAASAYRAQLADAPDDLASWAGLSTTSHELGVTSTLTTCPENVHAVHRELRTRRGAAPDVDDLADWVATGT